MRIRLSVRAASIPTYLLIAACVASCVTSSGSFMAQARGYAVTRGEITRIENLHTEYFERLRDGVAITISKPDCRVTVKFDERQQKTFVLGPQVILVLGGRSDYILQPQLEPAKGTAPKS